MGKLGWRFCREFEVHSDVLPALILVHVGSEIEKLDAWAWRKCPYNEANSLKQRET